MDAKMRRYGPIALLVATAVAVGLVVSLGRRPQAQEEWQFRVCADPNNLPYSNIRREGFEDKIAQIVTQHLHAKLVYVWSPQWRMTRAIREGLREGECDAVMGVPDRYPLLLTTRPYYKSTYVFVYRADRTWNVRSFDDPILRRLRIGLQVIGFDYHNTPPAEALAQRGIRNVVGYSPWDYEDPYRYGRIVEAVAKGEVDLAVVWGPIAGYFAKRQKVALRLVPVSPQIVPPMLPMVYAISMGVRHGDDALAERLNRTIEVRMKAIESVLRSYGVPLFPMP